MDQKQIEILSVRKLKAKSMYEVVFTFDRLKVSEDCLVRFELYKGKKITELEYQTIKKSLEKEEIFLKVCNYIQFQMRSKYEVEEYLKGLNCNDIDLLCDRLIALGYINDELLASNILECSISNLKGPKYFQEKLLIRKIKTTLKYDYEMELETIEKAIEKQKDNKKSLPIAKQKQFLVSKLLRDGFSNELVYSVVQEKERDGFFVDEAEVTIVNEIEKLKRKYQELNGYELKRKLITSLISKGYEYNLISRYIQDE